MRKFIAILCTITMIAGSVVVYGASGTPGDEDGDIVSNPWEDLFTTTEAVQPDLPTLPAETTDESQTTEAIGTNWTTIEASEGIYSYGNSNDMSVVNVQQPPWASEKGIYMHTKEAISYIIINGKRVGEESAAIDGAGAVVYLSALTSSVSNVVYCRDDGSVIASIDIKNANGKDTEETTNSQIETTTVTSETTTATQTTTATFETTTVTQTTTAASETTLEAIETTVVTETTVAPETTDGTTDEVTIKSKTPSKVKIKKVYAKRKTAKKVKISLKKVKYAAGYQIVLYKTKKNAKKNKKALVKKFVTKRKVTIKSKKLKNKKRLYVKARAYVLNAKKVKVYGKWSKIKSVKIKK